jgi:hypothetical protein
MLLLLRWNVVLDTGASLLRTRPSGGSVFTTGTCNVLPSIFTTGTCNVPPSVFTTGTCNVPPSIFTTGTCNVLPSVFTTGTCSVPPRVVTTAPAAVSRLPKPLAVRQMRPLTDLSGPGGALGCQTKPAFPAGARAGTSIEAVDGASMANPRRRLPGCFRPLTPKFSKTSTPRSWMSLATLACVY